MGISIGMKIKKHSASMYKNIPTLCSLH